MPPEISGRIVGGFNNSGVQRTLTRRQKPRNGANYREANAPDEETGLVGWRRSLDRTGLHHIFPANREFYREFRIFRVLGSMESLKLPVVRWLLKQIPYATEQGISFVDEGNSKLQ
jgi:hypothetical protein